MAGMGLPPNNISLPLGRRHELRMSLTYRQGFWCGCRSIQPFRSPQEGQLYGWLPLSNAFRYSFPCDTTQIKRPNIISFRYNTTHNQTSIGIFFRYNTIHNLTQTAFPLLNHNPPTKLPNAPLKGGNEPPAQGNTLGNKGNITDYALKGQKRYRWEEKAFAPPGRNHHTA